MNSNTVNQVDNENMTCVGTLKNVLKRVLKSNKIVIYVFVAITLVTKLR